MILMIKTKLALSVGGAAAGNALQGNEARPGPVRGTLAHTVAHLHTTQSHNFCCTILTVQFLLHTAYWGACALQCNKTRPGPVQAHSCTHICTISVAHCTLHTAHCILGYNYALQGNEARPGRPSLHTVQGTK